MGDYNSMISSELKEGVTAQTTRMTKMMVLPSGECKHTNSVRVMRSDSDTLYPIPEITKSTTTQNEQTLIRTIEVKYLNSIYLVQDVFDFALKPPEILPVLPVSSRPFISESSEGSEQSSESREDRSVGAGRIRKLCLFQKQGKLGKHFLKRNTKNIPKNFCKAFLSHLQRNDDHSSEWTQILAEYRKLSVRGKFNNIFMQKLFSNPLIAPIFRDFLQHHAPQWIASSKIADKQVHEEAIAVYLSLLQRLAYAEGQQ